MIKWTWSIPGASALSCVSRGARRVNAVAIECGCRVGDARVLGFRVLAAVVSSLHAFCTCLLQVADEFGKSWHGSASSSRRQPPHVYPDPCTSMQKDQAP